LWPGMIPGGASSTKITSKQFFICHALFLGIKGLSARAWPFGPAEPPPVPLDLPCASGLASIQHLSCLPRAAGSLFFRRIVPHHIAERHFLLTSLPENRPARSTTSVYDSCIALDPETKTFARGGALPVPPPSPPPPPPCPSSSPPSSPFPSSLSCWPAARQTGAAYNRRCLQPSPRRR
jgi:hypothetical protein